MYNLLVHKFIHTTIQARKKRVNYKKEKKFLS